MQQIHKRKFYTFLSHAHADKNIVDQIDSWLNEEAEIPVWYDARNLMNGGYVGSGLGEAIDQCRTIIIVLSKASVASSWVREEYEAGLNNRNSAKGFVIIPILIEDCEIPAFLKTTKYITHKDPILSLSTASELLLGLYNADSKLEFGKTKDLYISCSWRQEPVKEYNLAHSVCLMLADADFRLIGDSKDQQGYGKGGRVESIISSCGGLVSILPDRGAGITSKYMIDEIKIARERGIPYLIIKEATVSLEPELAADALMVIDIAASEISGDRINSAAIQSAIQILNEEWREPIREHYVFWAVDLDPDNRKRTQIIKRIIERVTAMPCVIGEDIREGVVQEKIKERITGAFMMLADISDESINICIEAGMAMGADVPLYLVAKGPRRKPPFMFRDKQVWYYDDDLQLLARIHKIIYPYRRRIINYELNRI